MDKDIKLSNIKGLLIFLVVFGHLVAQYQKSYNELYLLIYSFHMPLFIMLSGYFAKRASLKKVINLLLLYIIFQPLYKAFLAYLFQDEIFKLKYEVPYYHLWYLVSMMAWYLMIMGVKHSPLKDVNKIVFILGCGMIAYTSKLISEPVVTWIKNYDPEFYSYSYSYQRTLSFMPFFFLGAFLTKEKMRKLYNSLKGNKIIPIATIVGVYAYYTFIDSTNEEKILKGSYGVYQMKGGFLHNSEQILMSYIIAFLMCYMILNLVSSKRCFLTKWGDHSLQVFIFHAFFIMMAKKQRIYLKTLDHRLLILLLAIMSVTIVCILSSDYFVRCSKVILHPYDTLEKMIKKLRPVI